MQNCEILVQPQSDTVSEQNGTSSKKEPPALCNRGFCRGRVAVSGMEHGPPGFSPARTSQSDQAQALYISPLIADCDAPDNAPAI